MELHAYTKTISELFSVKKKYVVPRFQRPYKWTKEKVTELWEDIVSSMTFDHARGNFSHQEYFIGSLVLVGEDKSVDMQIVDGQQRLTTLTILLSVLCERFKEISKKPLAEAIYNNYIAGKDDDAKDYFKLENETPKPFFQVVIQHIDKDQTRKPTSEEENNLLSSYQLLYSHTDRDNLKKIVQKDDIDNDLFEVILKAVRDQVVNYLKVILIAVGEEDDAYTIFETLNARGMDLSFVDLIKNKLFKSYKTTHPDDFAKTQWKKLVNTIGSRDKGNLENFVRHWWISRYNYTSADNLYKHFKKLWSDGKIDEKKFLADLVEDADLYVQISSPETEDFKEQERKPLYRSLMALKIFNVSMHRPFVLSLFKAYDKKNLKLNDVKEVLLFIEKFHCSFNAICSMRPSGIEASYSKAARQLFEAKDITSARSVLTEFKKQMKKRLPEKETLKKDFHKLKYLSRYTKDKKLIQYIFTVIECAKQTTDEFKPDSLTLEHILSQSSITDETEDFVGAIGNLLPLASDLNKKAADKKFTEKLEIYEKSNFILTKEFTKNPPEKWEKEEIQARTSDLAEFCYTLMVQEIDGSKT